MLVFMHTDLFARTLLFLLFSFIHHAWSLGIDFTSPAGGATLPAGSITVQWSDAGGSPDMADLTSYTLDLMVGGVNPDDSDVIHTIGAPGALVAQGSVKGVIPASVAQSIQNGFYLRMTSNTSAGNEVLNYSDRFTLINMNGTTENQYLEAANAAASSVSDTPSAQYNVLVGEPPSTPSNSATATSTSDGPRITTSDQSTAIPPPHKLDVGGMSGTTKSLIIMGGLLAVIGAISIVLWIMFCCRRIRRKGERGGEWKAKEAQEDPSFLGNKTELAAYRSSRAVSTPLTPVEMAAERETQELSALDKAMEVPASPMVYELEGDMSAWEAGSGRKSKAWEAV